MNETLTPTIGIIGCGWVGLPLAKTLIADGHNVVATTQSNERLSELAATGAEAEILTLPVSSLSAENKVFNQACLLIAIPPKIKHGQTDYPLKIKQIVEHAEKNGVKRIVLISTTAVYNGLANKITEEDALDYTAPKVEILADAEQAALSFKGEAVVLRLAGLIGPGRHPARFINSPRLLASGGASINLIHLTDVIGLLKKLLCVGAPTGVFNGVNATHISKSEFYTKAAQSKGLPVPQFLADEKSTARIISSDKSKQILAYQYQYDDLIDWLAKTDD